jgi:hypothetical protein
MSSDDRSDDPLLRKGAESGDSYSQYRLGLAYGNESDPGYDPVKSADWLGRAARAGLSLAQVQYGVCHYYGNGVEKNHREALRWYYSAFLQLGPNSAYNIADLYDDSDEFPKNPIEAAAFFSLSLGGHNDAKQRLEAILPLLGHNDLARVVARAAMLYVLPARKGGIESISLAPGISLEPPDGPEPDDTPVTLLALLVRLHAVLDDQLRRKLLLEELAKGKSILYGACHVLNPGTHGEVGYQSYRPAFTMDLEGTQTAVLFTSQRNFISCNPVTDTLPMGMPCSTYLEMITKMELGAVRIDPGCFGDVTLGISEFPEVKVDTEKVDRTSLPSIQPTAPLPEPPPFTLQFHEQDTEYVAQFYPGTRTITGPDSEGRRTISFGENIDLRSLTIDGFAQHDLEPWKELVVRHLNTDKGLRDSDYSGIRQLEPRAFMSRVMAHYLRILKRIGVADWEVSQDEIPGKFRAASCAGGRELLLELRPRTPGNLAWTGVRLPMDHSEIGQVLSFVKSNQAFLSDLLDRHSILGTLSHVSPPGTEGFDVESNKWNERKHDIKALSHGLLMHMEVGLSPMDEEGAQRYARGLVCLKLALVELAQRALTSDARGE